MGIRWRKYNLKWKDKIDKKKIKKKKIKGPLYTKRGMQQGRGSRDF